MTYGTRMVHICEVFGCFLSFFVKGKDETMQLQVSGDPGKGDPTGVDQVPCGLLRCKQLHMVSTNEVIVR